jgi:hypothetical protein
MNDENISEEKQNLSDAPKVKTVNFKLICASKCKRFALEIAKSSPVPQRAKMFTRVSQEFLIACEINLKNFILNRVKSHPSKGKTLT